MINTILVEDDLYIQKQFCRAIEIKRNFFALSAYIVTLLMQRETAIAQYNLFLWMCKHSTSTLVLPPQNV